MFHKLLRIVKQNCQNSNFVYVRSEITPELKPPLASLSRSFHYRPPKKLGKSMFSGVSVRHSVYRGRSHLTITHDVFGLTVQSLTPSRHGGLPTSRGVHVLCFEGVISGGHHWRPVQACSLDLTVQVPTSPDMRWPP